MIPDMFPNNRKSEKFQAWENGVIFSVLYIFRYKYRYICFNFSFLFPQMKRSILIQYKRYWMLKSDRDISYSHLIIIYYVCIIMPYYPHTDVHILCLSKKC